MRLLGESCGCGKFPDSDETGPEFATTRLGDQA
jgi:hypothetical protein